MVTKDTGEHEDSCTSLYHCTQANERIGRNCTYSVLFRTFGKKTARTIVLRCQYGRYYLANIDI